MHVSLISFANLATSAHIDEVERQMNTAAQRLEFEEAVATGDGIGALRARRISKG